MLPVCGIFNYQLLLQETTTVKKGGRKATAVEEVGSLPVMEVWIHIFFITFAISLTIIVFISYSSCIHSGSHPSEEGRQESGCGGRGGDRGLGSQEGQDQCLLNHLDPHTSSGSHPKEGRQGSCSAKQESYPCPKGHQEIGCQCGQGRGGG